MSDVSRAIPPFALFQQERSYLRLSWDSAPRFVTVPLRSRRVSEAIGHDQIHDESAIAIVPIFVRNVGIEEDGVSLGQVVAFTRDPHRQLALYDHEVLLRS